MATAVMRRALSERDKLALSAETVVEVSLCAGSIVFEPSAPAAALTEAEFSRLVVEALASEGYDLPEHAELFEVSRELAERRRSILVVLAGTAGTGKSTLASLLADRLGITTIVTTDCVRHQLRVERSEREWPELFVSTYEAGEALLVRARAAGEAMPASAEEAVIRGYQLQCAPVMARLEQLLESLQAARESAIVEGVHVSLEAVARLMARYNNVVPFLVFISNTDKHRERFSVRGKYMTLDPRTNQYVDHLPQIRAIQAHLVAEAERLLVPLVDNTNVDRSVATIHSVLLRCLGHMRRGHALLDPLSGRAVIVRDEFVAVHARAWSSKAMQKRIKLKLQSRLRLDRVFLSRSPPPPPPPSHPPLEAPAAATFDADSGTGLRAGKEEEKRADAEGALFSNIHSPSSPPRRDEPSLDASAAPLSPLPLDDADAHGAARAASDTDGDGGDFREPLGARSNEAAVSEDEDEGGEEAGAKGEGEEDGAGNGDGDDNEEEEEDEEEDEESALRSDEDEANYAGALEAHALRLEELSPSAVASLCEEAASGKLAAAEAPPRIQ
jgi:2-phosphoglycerate kinase